MEVVIASTVSAMISAMITVIVMCILRITKDNDWGRRKVVLKKQKCRACGFKFRLEKENRYLARKGSSVVNALTERPVIIEMFDCPQCGCQNAVGVYEKPIEGEVK